MTNNHSGKTNQSRPGVKLGLAAVATVALLAGGIFLNQKPALAADIVVYKSPTCGCCKDWVTHLRDSGYTVETHDSHDVDTIKAQFGVPNNLRSCHTAKVGNYVIEGHVPAADIARLMKERPMITGLSAPGMPMGSPGMEGPRKDPYDVLTFHKDGKTSVYASHNK